MIKLTNFYKVGIKPSTLTTVAEKFQLWPILRRGNMNFRKKSTFKTVCANLGALYSFNSYRRTLGLLAFTIHTNEYTTSKTMENRLSLWSLVILMITATSVSKNWNQLDDLFSNVVFLEHQVFISLNQFFFTWIFLSNVFVIVSQRYLLVADCFDENM